MNAKLCKKLRTKARDLSTGMPARRLVAVRRTVINAPRTTRGIYRQLKKSVKRAA